MKTPAERRGTSPGIRPKDVIHAKDETDATCADRRAPLTDLWLIPDSA